MNDFYPKNRHFPKKFPCVARVSCRLTSLGGDPHPPTTPMCTVLYCIVTVSKMLSCITDVLFFSLSVASVFGKEWMLDNMKQKNNNNNNI